MMVTAEFLREAHDQAIASLNDAQRAAVKLMMDATVQASFTAPAAEARLARRLRADAASLNQQLLRLDAPKD
jgi:hypothetical protein